MSWSSLLPPPTVTSDCVGGRVRYVVQNVDTSTPLSSAQETVWRVQVRQEQNTSGRTFVLYVAQRPEKPAPYGVGGTLELDPRLVDPE